MGSPSKTQPLSQPSLQVTKQQLVRDTIWHAAINVFASNGFDETTIDDIAQAAGVSRRSFFRYFASKNDVLGQTAAESAKALSESILAAPRTYSPLEVLRDAVLRIAAMAAAYPRVRDYLQIIRTSPAARQAQLASQAETEAHVALAYAARFQASSQAAAEPRLLASLTLSILDVTCQVWFDQPEGDIAETAERMIASLAHLVCSGKK